MKKYLSLFFAAAMSSAFADGCTSLSNTSWEGNARLISGKIIPLHLGITQVNHLRYNYFSVAGIFNGKDLMSKGQCIEDPDSPGKVILLYVTIDNYQQDLTSTNFSPDGKDPARMLDVYGTLADERIDVAFPSQNYLIRKK